MKKEAKQILNLMRVKYGDEKIDKYIEQIKEPLKKDNDIARVEICVLKYKQPDIEKTCLNHIIDNTDHPYKLNFFDNRPNSGNMSKAWNKLIRESTCELVVIMDSDAFVQPGWLKPLVNAFLNHQDCMMAAPVTGGSPAATPQQIMPNGKPEEIYNGHLSGFCFMVAKSRIKKMGYFLEDFYIFGQDSRFCDQIKESDGWKMYLCQSSYVVHGFKGANGLWKGSTSTLEAAEKKEYDWDVETAFAMHLAHYLRVKDISKIKI